MNFDQPVIDNEAPEPKRYQCRHIFTDGHRCGSICLRGEPFCYYHHTTRKPAPRKTFGSHASFDLPLPEDRSAIQASIGIILQRIASNDLDPKRAGLLLYGLQIASLNLPKQQTGKDAEAPEQIQEITTHPELGTLAPQTEIKEHKSTAARLFEELTRPQPKPAVLPLVHATEDPENSHPPQHPIVPRNNDRHLRHAGRFARVGSAAIAARMESRRCLGFRLKKMPSPRNRSLTHVQSLLKKPAYASSAT
jgi:hypothetical protein